MDGWELKKELEALGVGEDDINVSFYDPNTEKLYGIEDVTIEDILPPSGEGTPYKEIVLKTYDIRGMKL